ncbi:YggT family protein [Desulfovibrio litoralis]|uniref:YggT family protein n=1 Tax=Desulfovibrio litoralis DSM 11393 TaxID=1121455 RepID=A0A1M7TI49_9BACT|nr:YggT family protein [Desulfovibrio litoralis]SHN70390.1 YggT family protein [Desulfovibrio litoralis DSM 11393]
MFAIGNIVKGIAVVLDWVTTLYLWIVIISALISWLNPDPYNPIVRTLRSLTEPVYYRIRSALPFVYSYGLDLSPIVVILALKFLDYAVIQNLYQFAARLNNTPF